MPEDEVAETIRSFRKNHLSELQVLAQIRCGGGKEARHHARAPSGTPPPGNKRLLPACPRLC